MSLIRLNNVSKFYDEKPILRDVFLRLSQGDRVGLIGRNGAGKTTLLKLILGQEEPNEGTVELDRGIRIGYFSQFSELAGTSSRENVLDDLFVEIHTLEESLLEIEIALEEGPIGDDLQRLLLRQADILGQIENQGGWNYQYKIDTVLSKLGFSNEHRVCPIDQLSEGWKNRAALAQILLKNPDVLLMDEPTNFLDLEGLTWLEEWLDTFRGALIIVSHDRHFIDRVVNRVIEIENYYLQEYAGS